MFISKMLWPRCLSVLLVFFYSFSVSVRQRDGRRWVAWRLFGISKQGSWIVQSSQWANMSLPFRDYHTHFTMNEIHQWTYFSIFHSSPTLTSSNSHKGYSARITNFPQQSPYSGFLQLILLPQSETVESPSLFWCSERDMQLCPMRKPWKKD